MQLSWPKAGCYRISWSRGRSRHLEDTLAKDLSTIGACPEPLLIFEAVVTSQNPEAAGEMCVGVRRVLATSVGMTQSPIFHSEIWRNGDSHLSAMFYVFSVVCVCEVRKPIGSHEIKQWKNKLSPDRVILCCCWRWAIPRSNRKLTDWWAGTLKKKEAIQFDQLLSAQ